MTFDRQLTIIRRNPPHITGGCRWDINCGDVVGWYFSPKRGQVVGGLAGTIRTLFVLHRASGPCLHAAGSDAILTILYPIYTCIKSRVSNDGRSSVADLMPAGCCCHYLSVQFVLVHARGPVAVRLRIRPAVDVQGCAMRRNI